MYCRIVNMDNNRVLRLELNLNDIQYYILRRKINLKKEIIELNEYLLDIIVNYWILMNINRITIENWLKNDNKVENNYYEIKLEKGNAFSINIQ